ncbi:hypothetical protein [Bdellovibrio sp. HCB2-146]|uniref:hypothetical protein n=1 Tax=Bdellovibrio sp. HCB2-146 TaxID=3394362 RepID=UPI0039BD1666
MKHLLIGLIILIGAGCTQQKTAGTNGNPSDPTSVPQGPASPGGNGNPTQSNGTGHSGGGNGLDGVALENHKFKVSELAVYKKTIEPLLEELRNTIPDLASDLEGVFKKKIWHMVDQKLSTISSENLSVAFATEQLALQNIYEVWIDKKSFEKMSEEAQETLLIHEAFMGIKISRSIEYKKKLNPNYLDGFERIKNKLEGKNILQIDSVDYEQIRTMTTRLLEKQFRNDLASFVQDLQSMGFGEFVSAEQQKSLHEAYNKEFTAKEMLEYLESEQQTGSLPKSCSYVVDLTQSKIKISAQIKDRTVTRDFTFSDEKSKSFISRGGMVEITLVEKSNTQIRNSRNSIRVKIQNDRIQSIDVWEEVYSFDLKGLSWKLKSESSFTCTPTTDQ